MLVVVGAPTVTIPADVWQQVLDALAQMADNASCPKYVQAAYEVARGV